MNILFLDPYEILRSAHLTRHIPSPDRFLSAVEHGYAVFAVIVSTTGLVKFSRVDVLMVLNPRVQRG